MIVSIVGITQQGPDSFRVDLFDDAVEGASQGKVSPLFVRGETLKDFALLVNAIRAGGFERITASGQLSEVDQVLLRQSWESYRDETNRITAAPSDGAS